MGGQSYKLYKYDRLAQDSISHEFGTAAASGGPHLRREYRCMARSTQPARLSLLLVREGAPLLILRAPDAEFSTLAPDIYSP